MSRKVRLFGVLLVLTALATGAAQAWSPMATPARASESGGIVDRICGWLASVLKTVSGKEEHKAVWEQDGSHIDPNG